MSPEPSPKTFAALLEAFPDLAVLARTLGVPYATVAAWHRRDSIPEPRWRSIAAAARRLSVAGVSYSRLSEASAAKARAEASTRTAPASRRTNGSRRSSPVV